MNQSLFHDIIREQQICIHQSWALRSVCKCWNQVISSLDLYDCKMDPTECRVWHGDIELYNKLDKLCRGGSDTVTWWDKFSFVEQWLYIFNALPSSGESYNWPAYSWLIDDLNKTPKLSYFKYVKRTPVLGYHQGKYLFSDPSHTEHQNPEHLKLSSTYRNHCSRYLPTFMELKDGVLQDETSKKIDGHDMFKGYIYMPCVRITPIPNNIRGIEPAVVQQKED
jgi:hypothetical protein